MPGTFNGWWWGSNICSISEEMTNGKVTSCDILRWFRDDDIKVDSISSPAASVDVVTDSSVIVPSFDIDDTPVTFRTRPTRSRLVSTVLRQRSMSQHIAAPQVPTHTTPTMSRHISTDKLESSANEKMAAPSLLEQNSPMVPQSTNQSFVNVKTPEETRAPSSSAHVEKAVIGRRSRSSVTKTDAVESPSSSPLNKLSLKVEDHQPVKIELQTTTPLPTTTPYTTTSPPQLSPAKTVSTASSSDSSTKFSEFKMMETMTSQISPIARNNQTLLEHLKRPPSLPGVPSDTVDVKKLRTSPPRDSKSLTVAGFVRSSAGESKSCQSFDRSSSAASSSLSVTLKPPSRQPLYVKTSSSHSTHVSSDQTGSTKSGVISPRSVSDLFTEMIIIFTLIYMLVRCQASGGLGL